MTDPATPRPWYRPTGSWLSVISLIIALASAGFAGLLWHEAHNQLLLSIRPHVDFDTEDDTDILPVGIAIQNAGPGPAIIKSLTCYVDRKRVTDYKEALEYGKINEDIIDYFEFDPDDAIEVGGKYWLLRYMKPRHARVSQKDLDDFADFIDQHVAVEVSFCSAMGNECWTKCSIKDRCQ